MSWNPYTHPINYFLLAGKKSPGIATIVGADRARKYDERIGYGLDFGWLIYNGRKLAHFTGQIRLYDVADWKAWEAFRPLVQKVPKRRFTADGPSPLTGKGLGAMDIWHPLLEPLGIKSVVVENEVQPVLEDETGVWLIEVRFIQYNPPKVALAKPQGAQGKAPPDATETRLLTNADTIKALGQELAK